MAVAAPDVEKLAIRVRRSTMRLRRRLRTEFPSGLSQTDYSALSSVVREGRVGFGVLAEIESIKPPSMTRIASALEQRGLVTRQVDPHDRRRASLEATPAGRRLVEDNRRQRDAYLATALRRLPARDLVTLDRATAVLERVLERRR
ncbi:MAG: MarR family winged helix-turn-helix transcriptional regulator [Candidatus Dormibacteraceae bacterium]